MFENLTLKKNLIPSRDPFLLKKSILMVPLQSVARRRLPSVSTSAVFTPPLHAPIREASIVRSFTLLYWRES
jgi:hypothetical protein